MRPDQRHEAHAAEVLFAPFGLAGAGDAEQRLQGFAADRHHQPAADRQLALERLGHLVAAGGDEDRVERRFVGQAEAAVAGDDRDIVVAERLDPLRGLPGQRLVPLDREDLPGDAAHNRRGVTRARADLEHPVARARRRPPRSSARRCRAG
jgi:hypothetical protein